MYKTEKNPSHAVSNQHDRHKLILDWFKMNHLIFNNKLKPLTILISTKKDANGEYSYRKNKSVSLAVNLLNIQENQYYPILIHEMIHQWQVEILGIDACHNWTFIEKCEIIHFYFNYYIPYIED